LAQPGADEAFPFGAETAVFRVVGKMFAILVDAPVRLSLKCNPGEAEALRATFPAVQPGYHLSKRHWNTVAIDGSVPDDLIREWIADSYDLVVAGLSKAIQKTLPSREDDEPDGPMA
jgi:predicted DNA-binding protein (MmcQ/YjbR family)